MKKQVKQNGKITEERQEERQTANDFYNRKTGEPVPQPKDYEDVDY
ncbi:hypothetical protein [Lederbergia citrea]|uniref:Uncharacterized protein n=1 Tax=Lederbergia citrea TaxID=2833581 RepID=A0A942Z2B0_9BACI|nr:hypothetical protein [Lederbergia citrea]MBS4204151.1 hypothetical protein [Lederbergia citrea]MBS4221264.1 hypothetical protein [Lederbergia citrea]